MTVEGMCPGMRVRHSQPHLRAIGPSICDPEHAPRAVPLDIDALGLDWALGYLGTNIKQAPISELLGRWKADIDAR